jgi:hypothetical protein
VPVAQWRISEHDGGNQPALLESAMTELNHPFYESHRDAMVAFTRQRLDLAEAMLR